MFLAMQVLKIPAGGRGFPLVSRICHNCCSYLYNHGLLQNAIFDHLSTRICTVTMIMLDPFIEYRSTLLNGWAES